MADGRQQPRGSSHQAVATSQQSTASSQRRPVASSRQAAGSSHWAAATRQPSSASIRQSTTGKKQEADSSQRPPGHCHVVTAPSAHSTAPSRNITSQHHYTTTPSHVITFTTIRPYPIPSATQPLPQTWWMRRVITTKMMRLGGASFSSREKEMDARSENATRMGWPRSTQALRYISTKLCADTRLSNSTKAWFLCGSLRMFTRGPKGHVRELSSASVAFVGRLRK